MWTLRNVVCLLLVVAHARGDLLPLVGDVVDRLASILSDKLDLPSPHNLKDGEEFDYVVVGAGAGGCAVASRLALAGNSVLLMEAGGEPSLLTRIPAAAQGLLGSPEDWQYKTLPNGKSCLSSKGKQCRFSRGKMLGGSTSMNFMMYVRGNRADFEYGPGWTWDDLKPYFLRYEANRDLDQLPESSVPYHNTTGIMDVGYCADPENDWHKRIVKGFKSLEFPYNPDVNAESQIGVSRILTYTSDGERNSAARAYLTNEDVRQTLRVVTGTRCTGVIIDDDGVARGVTGVRESSGRRVAVNARRGVVLSAGAVGTPQLLQLSGIGPAHLLKSLGIPVRADLPVGDNLSDHVLPTVLVRVSRPPLEALGSAVGLGADVVRYGATKKGPLASIGLTDMTVFANTSCYDVETRRLRSGPGCELPTSQFINSFIDRGTATLAPELVRQAMPLSRNVVSQLAKVNAEDGLFIASIVVLAPYSRGWVRIRTTDPMVPPDIFPNYLDDDRDVEEMVRAITILEHVVETDAFAEGKARVLHLRLPGCPSYKTDRKGYWRCYVRHMTNSVYHAAGSAALGSVLDARLRVRGVRSLHVADLSALPQVPRGNTEAVTVALGERLAEFLLEDQREEGPVDYSQNDYENYDNN